jgi:hypothetical protein
VKRPDPRQLCRTGHGCGQHHHQQRGGHRSDARGRTARIPADGDLTGGRAARPTSRRTRHDRHDRTTGAAILGLVALPGPNLHHLDGAVPGGSSAHRPDHLGGNSGAIHLAEWRRKHVPALDIGTIHRHANVRPLSSSGLVVSVDHVHVATGESPRHELRLE